MEPKVIHEKENKRFVIYTEDKEAFVEYRSNGQDLNLHHTFTHPALRSKGFAAQVVRAALELAKDNNLKVIPTCSYVRSFIAKNAEYQKLINN
jgi:predicted GNAT family acetyltransferase